MSQQLSLSLAFYADPHGGLVEVRFTGTLCMNGVRGVCVLVYERFYKVLHLKIQKVKYKVLHLKTQSTAVK